MTVQCGARSRVTPAGSVPPARAGARAAGGGWRGGGGERGETRNRASEVESYSGSLRSAFN